MNWLQKLMNPQGHAEHGSRTTGKGRVPEGVWGQCKGCGQVLYRPELERQMMVCPKCGYHHTIGARRRLTELFDAGSTTELFGSLVAVDTLKFRDSKRYRDRLLAAQKKTGEKSGMVAMQGVLKGLSAVAVAFEFEFMGGSMGSVVGEKFTRAAERALEQKIPFVCFNATGGARMQEGLQSLFQMAKTSAALARLRDAGVPYVSVLTNPTTGGVSASFAMLGDINIGEPGALIGFAGPRVIEQTVRETLPEGFQRAEFLLAHGALDLIVDRREMRDKLASLLALLTRAPKAA